jgi:hypothetical protein
MLSSRRTPRPPSGTANPNAAGSSSGSAAMAARSSADSGRTSSYQPRMVTRPDSFFMEARRRASSIAGLGAQLP